MYHNYNKFSCPPIPTRHVIVEKILDRDVANDKYIFAPGGCFWAINLGQCIITQFIYMGRAGRYVYFSKVNNKHPSKTNVIPIEKSILEKCIDTTCYPFYIEGQDSVVFSSYEETEKRLYSFAIPVKISYLTDRILLNNLKIDKKIQAKIFIMSLKKRLRRHRAKTKDNGDK